MFSIKFIDKSDEAPCGKVTGLVFDEASWLYGEDESPFKYEIFRDGKCLWSSDLYPGMWASWDTLDNDNFVAVIKDVNGNIVSQFKYDVWVNRNATEQFFDTWINKNPNSKGIVIGTHDGTTGEWVKHVKNKSTFAVLVEASKKQFDELVENYLNFDNVLFRNNVITGKGGDVEFYEFGLGLTNTIIESHCKSHLNEGEEFTQSIMRRIPTHEPWPHHENLDPEKFKPAETDRDIAGRYKDIDESVTDSMNFTPDYWKEYTTSIDTFTKLPPQNQEEEYHYLLMVRLL